jgi:hypothetical protein
VGYCNYKHQQLLIWHLKANNTFKWQLSRVLSARSSCSSIKISEAWHAHQDVVVSKLRTAYPLSLAYKTAWQMQLLVVHQPTYNQPTNQLTNVVRAHVQSCRTVQQASFSNSRSYRLSKLGGFECSQTDLLLNVMSAPKSLESWACGLALHQCPCRQQQLQVKGHTALACTPASTFVPWIGFSTSVRDYEATVAVEHTHSIHQRGRKSHGPKCQYWWGLSVHGNCLPAFMSDHL